jgi:hypothetical protein
MLLDGVVTHALAALRGGGELLDADEVARANELVVAAAATVEGCMTRILGAYLARGACGLMPVNPQIRKGPGSAAEPSRSR